jgi:hypothetical protein
MAVVNVPLANLDNVSDLADWLANELVTNHRFVEKRREGSIAGDDLVIVLSRPQSETFHNESEMMLLLDCNNTETATSRSKFQFNVSPNTYEEDFETTTPDSGVIGDWDVVQNELVARSGGSFTNWVNAGFTAGQYVRITNAASPSNDGLYEIQTFSQTFLTQDTMEFKDVSAGGLKDVQVADLTDTITVVEEHADPGNAGGFFNGEDSSQVLWNGGMRTFADTGPYIRARLITSPTSNSATPSEELHFILIMEVNTDVYTQMSFGEAVKLIPFTGGLYFSSNIYNEAVDIDAMTAPAWWARVTIPARRLAASFRATTLAPI